LPGDRLTRIGGMDLSQATWGAIYHALHGAPGESRSLTLERRGVPFSITATVRAF
jgi:C-terminal processing protease CtpA/Prc